LIALENGRSEKRPERKPKNMKPTMYTLSNFVVTVRYNVLK
jgi:hypothetical protein